MKERALSKTKPLNAKFKRYRPEDQLLGFLNNLRGSKLCRVVGECLLGFEQSFWAQMQQLRIRLAEGDSVPEENILPHVKPVVLAKNDPTKIGVFPHVRLRLIGQGLRQCQQTE